MKSVVKNEIRVEKESKTSSSIRTFDFKQFFSSPLLWILVCLIIVDCAIIAIKPLRFISIPGVLLQDQDPIGYRIGSLLNSKESDSVYLLGTSLSDSACANGDAVNFNLELTEYERGRYMHAKYFDKLLKNKLHRKSNSINLGVGGSMVSGEELILKQSLNNNTKPKLVVLMVAPRAFIDDTRSTNLYPIHCYFNNRFTQDGKLDWPANFNEFKEQFESLLAKSWSYFNMRSDYATVLTKSACSLFNRPESAYTDNAKQSLKSETSKKVEFSFEQKLFDPNISNNPKWVKAVSSYYDSAYGTEVNKIKLKEQTASFSRSLSMLKDKQIPALVVSMPLSNLNRNQIPGEFEAEYKNLLSNICRQYDTKLIYLLDDKRFILDDFRDSVHLNGAGATKFWNILVDEIARDPEITKSLVNR